MKNIGEYIKTERKKAGLTQEEFALRAGLGLRFVRELEQGKETVRLDKVNQAMDDMLTYQPDIRDRLSRKYIRNVFILFILKILLYKKVHYRYIIQQYT